MRDSEISKNSQNSVDSTNDISEMKKMFSFKKNFEGEEKCFDDLFENKLPHDV